MVRIREKWVADQERNLGYFQASTHTRSRILFSIVCEPMDTLMRGDVITIGDLSGAINKRSYTLAETSVNLITGEVSVTPEAPIKQLDLWLAQG